MEQGISAVEHVLSIHEALVQWPTNPTKKESILIAFVLTSRAQLLLLLMEQRDGYLTLDHNLLAIWHLV